MEAVAIHKRIIWMHLPERLTIEPKPNTCMMYTQTRHLWPRRMLGKPVCGGRSVEHFNRGTDCLS